MDVLFKIILPQLRLYYDPRWVFDVLQTGVLFVFMCVNLIFECRQTKFTEAL